MQSAAVHFPNQAAGYFVQDGDLYQLSVTPIYVQSSGRDQALINVLVAGYRVDALVAGRLKDSTGGSDFLFQPIGSSKVVSTLNPRATTVVNRNIATAGSELVSDGVSEYAWSQTKLTDISGRDVADLRILRSFEDARSRITALYTRIALLWLVALTVGFGLT
jgi:hypothetical protein